MASRPLSTANKPKKGGGIVKRFWDLIERPKSANDRRGVASQFAQTLIERVPGCGIDTNPVNVSFSIAKVIIEIKDVSRGLCILDTGWLLYQTLGDNNDGLAQCLEDTANRLLAVERTVVCGIPKASEEAMEKLKSYVVFLVPKWFYKEHVSIQEPWERNERIEGPCW